MFTLPNLPYAYDALEPYLDSETMHLHHDKHHAAYIKNLNDALTGHDELLNMDINDLLKNLDTIPEEVKTKVRNNGGGHANHSLFWRLLMPNGGREPNGEVAEMINSNFGSFNDFKDKFSKAALGIFGSGWAWVIKKDGKFIISTTPNQDSPIMEGLQPILGLDVWEHAYYLKYNNRRNEYIENWWNVINWEEVKNQLIHSS